MLLSLLFLFACETTIGNCVDSDGDGVGVGATCEQVDCDDNDPTVQVCGGDRPEDADVDADGYTAEVDCNDTDPAVNPGAPEACNDLDDDCDGDIDEDATDAATWFADTDGDDFGDPDSPVTVCEAPNNTVLDNTDCDDTQAAVAPGADERCNDLDDDCDGDVDEDAIDAATYYADTDGDDFGDPDSPVTACEAPNNTVLDNTDCDDTRDTAFPSADERCNDLDDDCDEQLDEDPVDAATYYLDADRDGSGDATSSLTVCDPPSGYAATGDDCDDGDDTRYPTALDYPGDSIDGNCDGVDLPSLDAPNAFYVSATLGNDATGDGTSDNPYATITHAISQSASGDWILVDGGAYFEDITQPRHVVGSFNAQAGWTLDLDQITTVVLGGMSGGWTATLRANETASLTGIDVLGSDTIAVNVSGEPSSQVVLHSASVSGRAVVNGASLGMLNSSVNGSQFALRVNQKGGNTTHITDSTLSGVLAGAWIGSDAVLKNSEFKGSSNGLLIRPDLSATTASLTDVICSGETNGATLSNVNATIERSEIRNILTLDPPATDVRALSLTQNANVKVHRSRIVLGSPSTAVNAGAFFSGAYVDSSILLLANSVVETWSDGEANSHAYGVRTVGASDLTLLNSTVFTDVREGNLAVGVNVSTSGSLTAINTALQQHSDRFQSNRGVMVFDTVPVALAGVAFSETTDPLVFAAQLPSGGTQLTALPQVELCDWGACDKAVSLLFEDLQLTDLATANVTPTSTSPLNNAGVDPLTIDPSLDPAWLHTDFNGNDRSTDGPWDIGAYEIF